MVRRLDSVKTRPTSTSSALLIMDVLGCVLISQSFLMVSPDEPGHTQQD